MVAYHRELSGLVEGEDDDKSRGVAASGRLALKFFQFAHVRLLTRDYRIERPAPEVRNQ